MLNSEVFNVEFGRRVKARRTELDMSQDRLAELIGLTENNRRSTISKIESGKQSVSNYQVQLLAQALQTDVPYLMGRDINEMLESYGNQMATQDSIDLSDEEADLILAWRKASLEDRQTAAFSLRKYGMPIPEGKNSADSDSVSA